MKFLEATFTVVRALELMPCGCNWKWDKTAKDGRRQTSTCTRCRALFHWYTTTGDKPNEPTPFPTLHEEPAPAPALASEPQRVNMRDAVAAAMRETRVNSEAYQDPPE